jgi:hypothetical protein
LTCFLHNEIVKTQGDVLVSVKWQLRDRKSRHMPAWAGRECAACRQSALGSGNMDA